METEQLLSIGLERVFSSAHHLYDRIFYDRREGKYWDRHSDIFISMEEFEAMKGDS